MRTTPAQQAAPAAALLASGVYAWSGVAAQFKVPPAARIMPAAARRTTLCATSGLVLAQR